MVDEEEITFAPTYRFERDTREKYVYTKAKATGVSFRSQLWLFSRSTANTWIMYIDLRAYIYTIQFMCYNKKQEGAFTTVSLWINTKPDHICDNKSRVGRTCGW